MLITLTAIPLNPQGLEWSTVRRQYHPCVVLFHTHTKACGVCIFVTALILAFAEFSFLVTGILPLYRLLWLLEWLVVWNSQTLRWKENCKDIILVVQITSCTLTNKLPFLLKSDLFTISTFLFAYHSQRISTYLGAVRIINCQVFSLFATAVPF